MKPSIPYTRPSITELEVEYVADAARNGWGKDCYKYIEQFESTFANHLNVKYAIATSSCTGALHMGLAALGIGPGDEVIVADTNWIASVAPVVYLGAKPVFVDILPDSWCLDPRAVQAAITPRTKAIIAVHLYGNLCEMDQLSALAEAHGISVVEDAAEAIGSQFNGRPAGSMSHFGVFSFHGTKTMNCGEGGAFVTDDDNLYEAVLTLSNHGRSRNATKQFWPEVVGFKYKMSNLQAALGCAQLQRIDTLISRKQKILQFYRDRLSCAGRISLNPEIDGRICGAWMPTAVFGHETGITRDKLLTAFRRECIDARVFFHPLSSLPMFKPCQANKNAWDIPNRAINLPSFHDISNDELERVAQVIDSLSRQIG